MMGSFQASVSHLEDIHVLRQTQFPGAVYTGLAVNQDHTMLYAANASAGTIDVFDSNFAPVDLGDHAFQTPGQIADRGLVPFNATDIDDEVYVTYAPSGRAAQITADEGDGAVAIFSESGNSNRMECCSAALTPLLRLRGVSLSLRTISVGSAATFWWATSASSTVK